MAIHPTALIDPRAEIDPSADIGPYAVVDGPVVVGPRTRLLAHAVVTGRTILGADNVVHMGAILGHEPQDRGWVDRDCALRVGDRNVFREYCQIHRASKPESATIIGNDNYFMNASHAAHDCRIGNHVIVAGGALLAGHVEVGDGTFVSGNCVVHQFVRIGRLALLRGLTRTSRDVPPFCILDGTHTVRGLNRVGLRRAGFTGEQIRALQNAFARLFHGRRNVALAVRELESEPHTAEVADLLAFIRASRRGVAVGPRQPPTREAAE